MYSNSTAHRICIFFILCITTASVTNPTMLQPQSSGYADPYSATYAAPAVSGYVDPYATGYSSSTVSGYTDPYAQPQGYATSYQTTYPSTGYPTTGGQNLLAPEIARLNQLSMQGQSTQMQQTYQQGYQSSGITNNNYNTMGMQQPTAYGSAYPQQTPGQMYGNTQPNYQQPAQGYGSTNSAYGQTGIASSIVTTTEAEASFDDAATIARFINKDDFVAICLKLEKVFNGCNFSQNVASTDAGVSSATLMNKAVTGIQKIMDVLTPGYKNVTRKLTKKVSGSVIADAGSAEEEEKWSAMAYMLSAAEHNQSFKKELSSRSLAASAKIFWQTFQQVFSVQPVAFRKTTLAGTFIPDANEKAFIDKLFQIEDLLNQARAVDVEVREERVFVQAARQFSKIIIDPQFYISSVGLKMFAFQLFKEGILKWLFNIKGISSEDSHDELWVVAAEAFNIMHNCIVGPQMTQALDLASFGVNRINKINTDHLLCSPAKGSLTFELQSITLGFYTKNLTAIMNYFTKRTTDVAGQAGFLAKNDSDMLLLHLSAEMAEYTMEESTAADAANLIGYFFEKGFRYNQRTVNWNSAQNSFASFPGIVLDRLYQKTATSKLSSIKLIGNNSSSSTMGSDYTSQGVLEALLQSLTTVIESSSRTPVIAQKTSKILAELKKRRTSLQKNSKLKAFKLRPRVFMNPAGSDQMIKTGMPMTPSASYGTTIRQPVLTTGTVMRTGSLPAQQYNTRQAQPIIRTTTVQARQQMRPQQQIRY